MTSFAQITEPSGPLHIPEDWMQGRTAFGGIQAAAALRAAQSHAGDGRSPRAVSVSFVGPAGSEGLSIEPTVLRSGGSVTHVRADVLGAEGVACTLSAALGRDRDSSVRRAPQTHGPLPPSEAGMAIPYLPGLTPVFVQHFDLRFTSGAPPVTGQHGPLEHEGWCRHLTEPGPAHAALLGLLDAWPSPALQALAGPAPASTVTWSVQFAQVPERITTHDAFFFRARVLAAPGTGYVTMRGELYDTEGVLTAHLEQLVTLYG